MRRVTRFTLVTFAALAALAVALPGCAPPRPRPNLLKAPSAVDLPGTLVVFVRESGSHQPVPYATVTLRGRDAGTLTNADGAGLFRDLRPGRVVLLTSMLGFENSEDSIVVRAGRRDTIGVTLEAKPWPRDPHLFQVPQPPPRSASPDTVEI